MDTPSKKDTLSTATKPRKKAAPRFKLCLFVKDGVVTKTQCQRINKVHKNNRLCVAWNCRCSYRICTSCLKHKTATVTSELGFDKDSRMDCLVTSLCPTHIDQGEDFVIGTSKEVVIRRQEDTRKKKLAEAVKKEKENKKEVNLVSVS